MPLNQIPYNQEKYNGPGLESVNSTDAFTFDGYGLQNSNITVTTSNHSTAPSRDIQDSRVPRADGRIISGNFFDIKTITLKGHARATTASDLEDLLEEMKRVLTRKDKILQITEANGTVKQWVANLRSPDKLFSGREAYHITFVPFEAEFVCVDPFGKAEDYSSNFTTGITVDTINRELDNAGSGMADLLIILNALSATALASVTFTNLENSQSMRISPVTVNVGDVFILDSENQIVSQNGTALDYEGSFIELEPGVNNIQIDISSTSHNLEVTLLHKNAYL